MLFKILIAAGLIGPLVTLVSVVIVIEGQNLVKYFKKGKNRA